MGRGILSTQRVQARETAAQGGMMHLSAKMRFNSLENSPYRL
jgi:hypothetical protein